MGGFGLPSLVPQQLRRRLTRELPMRRTTTLVSKHDGRGDGEILKVEVKKDREGLAVMYVLAFSRLSPYARDWSELTRSLCL
jgi:hypothetical protein